MTQKIKWLREILGAIFSCGFLSCHAWWSEVHDSSSPSDEQLWNAKHKEKEEDVPEVFKEVVEVSPALELEMNDNMLEQLDEILVKLNMLHSIKSTLSNLCSKMASVEGDIIMAEPESCCMWYCNKWMTVYNG